MKKQKKSRIEIISAQDPDYSTQATAVIRSGGVVAFPTETSYGLGVDPFNRKSVERLFALKERIFSKAILVIIHDLFQLKQLVMHVPKSYHVLIKDYWPGPLTLVFPALPNLPDLLTGGTGTIAVRMSSGPIASRICSSAGIPISATSANISGQSPAMNVSEVTEYFGSQLDLIIDGGPSTVDQCSTIVGLENDKLTVIRPGIIPINHE